MKQKQQRMQRRQRRGRARNLPVPPSSGLLVYKGPVPTRTAEDGITAVLRVIATFNTGAGTGFNSIIDNNPSGCDNWSEYSTSWSEYRVLGIKFQYVPQFKVNTSTLLTNALVHSILHMKSNPAVSSYANGFSYGDSYLGHVTERRTMQWKMSTPEEATFLDCTAPAGTAVVYTSYADTLTTATNYGQLFITYLVQFRNSRK